MFNKHAVLGGRDRVKVAIAQIAPRYLDKVASIEVAIAAIKEASLNKADLVVFPELSLHGYSIGAQKLKAQASTQDGQRLIPLKKIAKSLGIGSRIREICGCSSEF